MKASVVELRYKMKEVLKALHRNEEVEILYHGKTAGRIIPVKKKRNGLKVSEHPLFGMIKTGRSRKSVEKIMNDLRRNRYDSV